MIRGERFCFYSLVTLIVWLPLPLASHRVWAWSIFEIWISLQTLILMFTLKRNFPWHRVKRFYWLLIPLVLFQFWVLIQLIPLTSNIIGLLSPKALDIYSMLDLESMTLSLDRYATITALLKGVAYTMFVFNAVILINSIDRVKSVLLFIVISGTFQAFYAAIVVLLGTTKSWVFGFPEIGIATGSFVYKNHLANYLMMTLSLGVGLIVSQLHQSESDSWQVLIKRLLLAILSPKMLVRLCLVIMVIGLVMTRSRMGNTAFFSVTIIGGVVALLFYKNRPKALTILIISLIAVDTLVVGAIFGLGKVKQRLENTSMVTETRDQVVEWSIDIINDYPITGTGMGSFYSTFPSYTKYNVGYYDFAHNDYIQFAVEAGIPATLLLGMSVLYALWLSFNAIRTRNSKTLKGTGLGCFMAIVGMLIHISVDFNLQPPANAVTFLLILVLAGCSVDLKTVHKKQ